MIQKEELDKILNFVASRWNATVQEPNNKAMEGLPNDFWMNSIGGKTVKGGFWVTTIMYTENEADAAGFKEVLLRWQTKGNDKNKDKGPDLIQIGKKKIEYYNCEIIYSYCQNSQVKKKQLYQIIFQIQRIMYLQLLHHVKLIVEH